MMNSSEIHEIEVRDGLDGTVCLGKLLLDESFEYQTGKEWWEKYPHDMLAIWNVHVPSNCSLWKTACIDGINPRGYPLFFSCKTLGINENATIHMIKDTHRSFSNNDIFCTIIVRTTFDNFELIRVVNWWRKRLQCHTR